MGRNWHLGMGSTKPVMLGGFSPKVARGEASPLLSSLSPLHPQLLASSSSPRQLDLRPQGSSRSSGSDLMYRRGHRHHPSTVPWLENRRDPGAPVADARAVAETRGCRCALVAKAFEIRCTKSEGSGNV